jgi:hypothetical protein
LAGESPAEAVAAFIEPLRRFLSCVTDRVLVATHYHEIELDQPRALTFGRDEETRVRLRDDLMLDVAHFFEVVEDVGDAGPFRCHTRAYSYDFRHVGGPSVVAFHYHPESRVILPHAHVHQYTQPVDLSKVHLPTGRTTLESIIRLAIEEFGAVPHRDDWDDVLMAAEANFRGWRTW